MNKISEIYAFISLDDKDQTEKIPAISGPFVDGQQMMLPLIATSRVRLDELRPSVISVIQKSKKPMKLVKFTQMEVIEEFQP